MGRKSRTRDKRPTKTTKPPKLGLPTIIEQNGVRVMPPMGETRFAEVETTFKGLGYERVQHLPGSTYQDASTVIIIPSREDKYDQRVMQSWMNLMPFMNQKRAMLFATGDEVGHAYTKMVRQVLADSQLGKWKYIMTMETDNLPPPDAHIKLVRAIEHGKYDGVSGIYYTKGDLNMPMAYGDPAEYAKTGVLDFRPQDIRVAQAAGQIIEVNGIAMGCSLYRMELFREIPEPWFVTVSEMVDGAPAAFTQDLYFCKNAREKGKRFAVDLSTVVGHLDFETGIIH